MQTFYTLLIVHISTICNTYILYTIYIKYKPDSSRRAIYTKDLKAIIF